MGKSSSLIDFDDARGDVIKEIAIVRDEDDRAGKAFEIIFQPTD